MMSLSRLQAWLITVALLLAAFWLSLHTLTTESLWLDEAYSAWAVRDALTVPDAPPDNLIEATTAEARRVFRSLRDAFINIRDDVHPPLYYLLLDSWTLLFGDSELMLRLPSVLMGLIALSATYALGTTLFSRRAGWIAILLTGSAGFFLYYTQEARMYTLYLALITLCSLVYIHWQKHPTVKNSLLYALLMLLALYTHYISALFLLAQGLHLLLMLLMRVRRWQWHYVLPFATVIIGYAPWLPFALRQWQLHPAGAAAASIPSDAGALAAIWLILTHGYAYIYLLPFGVLLLSLLHHDTRTRLKNHLSGQVIGFLMLWLIVPVLLLFAINATGRSLLQLRYLLPMLPAWTLLIAWALHYIMRMSVSVPRAGRMAGVALSVVICGWLVYTQLATQQTFWPDKPRWREAVAEAAAVRTPLEGALTIIEPQHPTGYYAPRYDLTAGYTIAVGWRDVPPATIAAYAATFADMPAVWVIAPAQTPQAWNSIYALQNQGRGVGYRDSVQGTIFYRMDSIPHMENTRSNPLTFTFEDSWQYLSHDSTRTDDELCVTPRLQALKSVTETHEAVLHLTRGYNEVIAEASTELPLSNSDDITTPQLCLTLPSAQNDIYHLRLMIDTYNSNRLLLLEDNHLWGNYLMLDVPANIWNP